MAESRVLKRVRTLVLALLTVQFLVLAVTGVVLYFTYRPSSSGAWSQLFGEDVRSSVDRAHTVAGIHRWAARSAVPVAFVAGVLIAIQKRPWVLRRLDVLLGTGLALVMVAGSATGNLLPWDQLGLRAVSVGSDTRGYQPLFDDDQVRFVLINGAEVAPETVVRWLVVHALVVGTSLGVLLALAWRRQTRSD